MKNMKLNPCNITGPINSNTPTCVILDIARNLGFTLKDNKEPEYIHMIISSINELPDNKIFVLEKSKSGYTKIQLDCIARFVNPNVDWKLNYLLEAFNHLMIYYNNPNPPLPTSEWKYGQKTTNFPYAYNNLILYRLCSYYNIVTNRNTTTEQMANSVRLINDDLDDLKSKASNIIDNLSKTALINFIITSNTHKPNIDIIPSYIGTICNENLPTINPKSIDSKLLDKAFKNITEPSAISRIRPNSQYEAIILAAYVYGINLTQCTNPYKEYIHMWNDNYIPLDEEFKKRYTRNPSYFDVRKNWCNLLSIIYKPADITRFAKSEGYDESDFLGHQPDQLLYQSKIIETFHIGYHPDSSNTKTIITLDELRNIDPKRIVTYGIDNEPKTLIAYDINEIAQNMESTKSFIVPNNPREKFSDKSIKKLKMICHEYLPKKKVNGINNIINAIIGSFVPISQPQVVEHQHTELTHEYENLLRIIKMVELHDIASSNYANKLRQIYMDSSNKSKIKNVITDILECGYYMRAWKVGSKELPITAAQSQFPTDFQGQVDLNVSKSILKLERDISDSGCERLLWELPLMTIKKSGSEIRYQCSTNEDVGLTLKDRIKIVKDNDKSNSNACIRLTSNWLMITGYYYSIALSLPAPFDINLLDAGIS